MLNINTNVTSLNAQRQLHSSQNALKTSMERLSSGLRINSAKDDSAGHSISERMTSQIRGMNVAARNANDGISLAQTAEGGLHEITNNLQRLRDLSVQAANATNTAADRAALDGEAKQLIAEIDRVSTATQFNGISLLDGSFTAQNFQVGASAGQVIEITSITSAHTSALGGVGSSYAATLDGVATTGALSAGDLTLNGFQVGASQLGSLPGQSTASAYSVAQAINTISSDSGVTATANATTVTGGAATAFTAIAADTFSINGINVGAVAAGTTAAGQGANLASAINQVSSQTGVTASANATTGALALTAADGRDINIGLNGTAADATTAATNKTTLLNQTGLVTGNVGTQASDDVAVTAATSGALGAFTAGGLSTGGYTYTLTLDDGVNPALNLAETVADTDTGDAASFAAILNGAGFTGDGETVSGFTISYGVEANAADALTNGTLSFSRADGVNFDVSEAVTNPGNAAATPELAGVGAGITTVDGVEAETASAAIAVSNHGTVSLSSTSANGIVFGGTDPSLAGFAGAGGTVAATTTSQVSSIASMNLLTADSATSALSAIDGALSTVNVSRGALGAYQNRFSSTIANLQTSAENLSAARGRIQDADFATETAAMTRGQILQQAGVAMLAQANQLPQSVLGLLR